MPTTKKKPAKKSRSGSPSRPARSKTKATRVFLIDDEEIYHHAIRDLIECTPEHDMAFAGATASFEPIPSEIRNGDVDVVLIDIADEGRRERPVGLRTMRAIRRELGNAIGIIGYSIHPEFGLAAEECGADTFVGKEATSDLLRQKIRTCKDHDVISHIALNCKEREIAVTISRNGVSKYQRTVSLQRDSFALVHYLAKERLANECDWITKEDSPEKGPHYHFEKEPLWLSIRNQWSSKGDIELPERKSSLESSSSSKPNSEFPLAQKSSEVNKAIEQAVSNDCRTTSLIITPGVGRKPKAVYIYAGTYFLNPFIEARQVTIL